jgi:hypothetical protein
MHLLKRALDRVSAYTHQNSLTAQERGTDAHILYILFILMTLEIILQSDDRKE